MNAKALDWVILAAGALCVVLLVLFAVKRNQTAE